MDSLDTILGQIDELAPSLRSHLSLSQIYKFLLYTSRLKNDIILTQRSTHNVEDPPVFLPPVIVSFLSEVLNLPDSLVDDCWSVFKNLIWNTEYIQALQKDPEDDFQSFGLKRGLGM